MPEDGRSRLGRGLAALIGDIGAENATPERARNQRRVPIEFLKPNPRNPRKNFSDAELDELATSIKERGIIQPVVVRALRGAKDSYEIIAGERRWRAAQRAGLHDVPIVPLEATDSDFKGTPLGWAIYGSENGWSSQTGDYAETIEVLIQAGARLPEQLGGTEAVREVLRRHGMKEESI